MKTPLNFLKYHPQTKLETKCPLQPQRRDREEGWSNCSSRLPSHLTLDSSMALPSPQVGMDLVETNNIWQKSLFLLSNKYIQIQATTPLSLFLNTSEGSSTPVQRSITPLLFPEHRLQTPGLIQIFLCSIYFSDFRSSAKQWQIPLIKSPSCISVRSRRSTPTHFISPTVS